MDRVVKYVNAKLKHAGHTKEVQSQKEELVTGLREKITDAMSHGKTESEAFNEAVASLDGMEELTEALNRKRSTVYVNRLNFHHSLMTFGLIALEILACGCYYLIGWLTLPPGQQSWLDMPYFDLETVVGTFVGLGIVLSATTICPLIRGILYRVNPGKVKLVEFNFKQKLRDASVGLLVIFIALTIINVAPIEKFAGPMIWFIWPLIGATNWPISVIIYDRLFKNERYMEKSALSGAL